MTKLLPGRASTANGEDPIKRLTIALLTILFVGLYFFAIVAVWVGDSAANSKAIALLQPIVYVIIGYYFGRLPSEKVEKQLKDEAMEKSKQADTAIVSASSAASKLAAVKALLSKSIGSTSDTSLGANNAIDAENAMRLTIVHALNVLEEPIDVMRLARTEQEG